jgi:DNA polymerase I
MTDRLLIASGTNLLARGFLAVPTDRKSKDDGSPVNALFFVARSIHRVLAFKAVRAVAVIDTKPNDKAWPPILKSQLPMLAEVFRTLGITVVETPHEEHIVASYCRAALDAGGDAIIAGVDKRYAQLVEPELVWWYDANKDVRYTPDIVQKRFNVGPTKVGEWLAMVGDDSGNEVLPGIKGVGAKGATQLIEEHGSIAEALAKLEAGTLEGRLAKPLKAAKDEIPKELDRGRLDQKRKLPVPLEELTYTPPAAKTLNALYDRLGFAELLVADGGSSTQASVCEKKGDATAALAKLDTKNPIAIHILLEDPAPVRAPVAGLAL